MEQSAVQVVELPELRVASVHGFGTQPEFQAWGKLTAWAEAHGYLADRPSHRVFGFNNPDPSPASPNYGYELWMMVGPEQGPEGDVEIKTCPGGRYAVLPCPVPKGDFAAIGAGWKQLIAWRENSPYRYDHSRQCLEEHVETSDPALEFVLHLYMPVA